MFCNKVRRILADFLKTAQLPNSTPWQYFLLKGIMCNLLISCLNCSHSINLNETCLVTCATMRLYLTMYYCAAILDNVHDTYYLAMYMTVCIHSRSHCTNRKNAPRQLDPVHLLNLVAISKWVSHSQILKYKTCMFFECISEVRVENDHCGKIIRVVGERKWLIPRWLSTQFGLLIFA